jgi:hypothetical protein
MIIKLRAYRGAMPRSGPFPYPTTFFEKPVCEAQVPAAGFVFLPAVRKVPGIIFSIKCMEIKNIK